MNMRLLSVVTAALLLTGCANAPITLNYAPSSTMSVKGALKVGDFQYLPGKEGKKKVKPNQIRNTAMGEVLLEKNVDEYFESALFTESRFVGINVGDTNNVVSGDIIEFLIDDLGYSIDWTLDVKYIVKSADGSDCYNKVHKIAKNTAKFANPFGTLNEVMKLNIEQAFQDPAFQRCINN